jgi:mannose-6-phosphate isomerase-like protein (cupin superfamily)
MKFISKNQTKEFKNSEVCKAIEYPMGDKDINGAVIELSGRYPGEGRTMNEKCKEMAYVIEGSGRVVAGGTEVLLNKGDLVLIYPGENFFWEGKMTLFMPCTPAWSPEQHKEVE